MFEINTDGLRTSSEVFREGSELLNRTANEIEDIQHRISGLSGMETIIASLTNLCGEVRKEATQQQALYETGTLISRYYDDCEDDILSNISDDKFRMETSYRLTDFSRARRSNERINRQALDEVLELFS